MCFIKCILFLFMYGEVCFRPQANSKHVSSYRHFTLGMNCVYVDNDFAIIDYPQRAYNVMYLTVYI